MDSFASEHTDVLIAQDAIRAHDRGEIDVLNDTEITTYLAEMFGIMEPGRDYDSIDDYSFRVGRATAWCIFEVMWRRYVASKKGGQS